MPRPIAAFNNGPGFAEYTLSGSEAWTPLALTCHIQNNAVSPIYCVYVQFWDSNNFPIYSQFVGEMQTHSCSLSLAAESEPWYHENNGVQGFPQDQNYYLHSFVGIRMARIPLTAGCVVGVYITGHGYVPRLRPIGLLEPLSRVDQPHLWVEDSAASRLRNGPPPVPVGPYMLVPGPLETSVAA